MASPSAGGGGISGGAAGEGGRQRRRLRHLVEANARRIPELEAKLQRIIVAVAGGGGDAGAAAADGSGASAAASAAAAVSTPKRGSMQEVLENRLANQQAEWRDAEGRIEEQIRDLQEQQRRAQGDFSALAAGGDGGGSGNRLFTWLVQWTRKLQPILVVALLYWVYTRMRRRMLR